MTEKKKQSKRILTLDLLRGYFLVVIILDHLQWYPNAYDWVAFRGSLVVSAAEGFFLISGLVLGIIRGRKLLGDPFRKSALLIWARGARLYIVSIVLMLLFTLIGWFFIGNPGLKPGIRPIDQPFLEVLAGAFSLRYIYGWADFLRLYAVFMFIAPFMLWLIRRGKWYIGMALSAGLWALYPFALENTANSGELLMVLSWQFIFFAGFTIGFYWEPLAQKWSELTKKTRQWILYPVLALGAVTLLANIIFVVVETLGVNREVTSRIGATLYELFDKNRLSPLRLLMFANWFILGYYIFMRFEKVIVKYLGWILLPFGSNSLYVYIVHAILLFFAHLIMPPQFANNFFLNFIGTTIVLALVWTAVRTKFLFKIIPR